MKKCHLILPVVCLMAVSGAMCYAENDRGPSEPWKTMYAETERTKAQIRELELKIMSLRIALDARMDDMKNRENVAAINRKVIEKLSRELQQLPPPVNKSPAVSGK